MLEEKVYYSNNIPIKIFMCSVEEYPIHYHQNDLELMVVLDGYIKLVEGYRTLLLKKGEVFIVNEWELHGIYSTGIKNKILFIQIDLTYFKSFDKDFYYFFLVADTYHQGKKYNEPEKRLKQKIFEIVETALIRDKNYESKLIELSQSMLSFLKNNFQYFSVYEDSYFINKIDNKDNQVQAKRVMEVYRYICENYEKKITLKECANEKHINMYYLSHIIKDSTGLSFQELLNFTRIEASEKLLLETNKKISEIALACGFSATRYYIKSFEKWYKTSPQEYRTVHRKRAEAGICQEFYTDQDILNMIDSDADNLTSSKYNYTNRYIKVIRVDIKSDYRRKRLARDCKLILNDIDAIADETIRKDLDLFRRHTELYGEIFPDIMNTSGQKLFKVIGYAIEKRIDALLLDCTGAVNYRKQLETIVNLADYCRFHCCHENLQPIRIFISQNSGAGKKNREEFASFMEKLKNINTSQDMIVLGEIKSEEVRFSKISYIYDSIYYVPFALHNLVNGKYKLASRLIDKKGQNLDLFQGSRNLITWNGIKKPIYYAYFLFSLLGDEVVHIDSDTVITKNGSNMQLLFYDYSQENYSKIKDLTTIEQLKCFSEKKNIGKEYVVELKNLKGCYKVTHLKITRDNCIFHKWMDLGKPKILSFQEEDILKRSLFPEVRFEIIEAAEQFDISISIPQFGAKMILLEKV